MTEEERDKAKYEALRALADEAISELERVLHQFVEGRRRIEEGQADGAA